MEPRISLVTLGVADLDRARAFYEALGWRSASDEPDVVFFQSGGMVLALWGREMLAEDSGVHDGGGWGGVALAHNVRSPAEVDAVLAEARVAGATIARLGRTDLLGRLLRRLRRPGWAPLGGRPQPGLDARRRRLDPLAVVSVANAPRAQRFDFVIIGAGPAGEAAAYKARELGASVAVVERDLFGGSCPHWGCVPSKTLLNGAHHRAWGGDYPWTRASDRRDYMINRVGLDYPDDSGHVQGLEAAGATAIRGAARLDGPGRVQVTPTETRWHPTLPGDPRTLEANHVILALGSSSKVPPVAGIETIRTWTNRDATSTRTLPRSLLVLGGGPTGVELAEVFARFGVPVTIVQSGGRLAPTDHPRNSEAARRALERDGVTIRLGVRAQSARAAEGTDGADVIDLDDGSSAEGHVTLLAVGRTFPLADLGLESVGLSASGLQRDGRLQIGEGLWVVGDPAGPELHTHQAHYQGETAVRMALGEPITPDYRALPRATYIEPELASVGLSLDQALGAGLDAFEQVAEFPTTIKGYTSEAEFGHVTIVVDRRSRELVGAAMAVPDASAAIHECVLAIKAHVPIDVLAETIHAFPSTSRILNGLFADARRELAG